MSTAALEWIERKKHGGAHPEAEIRAIVGAVTDGSVPDYQLAAWLMAVWQRGLGEDETVWLTEAMRDSGERLRHPRDARPTADKHSTGGVGDKASLVVAPLAAALGMRVPMMSGRGLGHTGGTLDKLQAMAGYRTDLEPAEFARVLDEVGCSIIGQTDALTPADRRLYALRDVTGTVDSIPLITSSILSKKLAAGPEHLVIDLKCGSGAFMTDEGRARDLARALLATGRAAGLRIRALLTDMGQPLGRAIGHVNEVRESLDCMRGSGPEDLRELSIELAVEMGDLAGLGAPEELRTRAASALDTGAALERFLAMVLAHGGKEDFEERLVEAPESDPVCAAADGYLVKMRADEFGRALIDLGGGRREHTDRIDPAVGLRMLARVGDAVEAGQPLVAVNCGDRERARRARERIARALEIGPEAPEGRPLILERLRP